MLNLAEVMIPFPPREKTDNAMDDERRSETPGRRESDSRPSAWNDPRFWLSVLGIILTIVLTLLAYITNQLAAINVYQKSTNDAVIIVSTKQASDKEAMDARLSKLESGYEARISKLENAMTVQQQAYNYNLSTRLAVAEARAGIKPQPQPGD